MTEQTNTVGVPGVLRQVFRDFLAAAPADADQLEAMKIWDGLNWRGRPRGESADITVTEKQATYLRRQLEAFITADGTMLARPGARKLRDRLSVGWERGWG